MPDSPVATSPAVFQSIPLDQIKPSRHQARKQFDEAGIKGLADSIANEGLQNPITVRKVDGGYELISGERRFRAMKLLGKPEIDAHIVNVPSEASAAAKGLVENLQRQDLNPIEEAEGFRDLLKLGDTHWTQEQIGKVAGKDQTYVSKSVALLALPQTILESMRQRILSREHGIELLRLNNANSSKSTAIKIVKGGWSVKKTREAIDKKLGKQKNLGDRISNIEKAKSDIRSSDVDPLSALWSRIKANQGIGVSADWEASYGPKEETWTFTAKPHGGDYESFLSSWFSEMAEAISPLKTPKFTKAEYDSATNQIELAWDFVSFAKAYEIHYSFNYPGEPLKAVPTELPIYGPKFTVMLQSKDRPEVWLAIRAVAAAGRASPISEPVHLPLQ